MVQRVHSRAAELQAKLREELKWRTAQGVLTVQPDGQAVRHEGLALQLLFGFFIPEHMGIIDYHGSHRKYDRSN